MSTQSINSPKPDKAGELGPAMKGADVLVSALEREGVEVVLLTQVVPQWNCINPLHVLKR